MHQCVNYFKHCSDLDECDFDFDNCGENANCINTPGSFFCICKSGYIGNGTTCEGKFISERVLYDYEVIVNSLVQI